ncbi:hypothetical protein TNCV_44741 [Trichonephila clavipes]|nr:hypothetical protein TNCV_44741 [Trichonephila clavipes]
MPSPVQSNSDAHDTIANGSTVLSGQWNTHNKVCVRIVLLLKRLATVFREICFPEAARNWICLLLSCGAPVPLLIGQYIVFCRRRTSNTTSPPCRLLHIPQF